MNTRFKLTIIGCITLISFSILNSKTANLRERKDIDKPVKYSGSDYMLIQGNKPADAHIEVGYINYSDTNPDCVKTNPLSGTKYLSSFKDYFKYITYSEDAKSYEIKIPINIYNYDSYKKCGTKPDSIRIQFRTTGSSILFANLRLEFKNKLNPHHDNLNANKPNISAICGAEFIENEIWSKSFYCSYFINDNKFDYRNSDATIYLSHDTFHEGMIINYDVIEGENFFKDLSRPGKTLP